MSRGSHKVETLMDNWAKVFYNKQKLNSRTQNNQKYNIIELNKTILSFLKNLKTDQSFSKISN